MGAHSGRTREKVREVGERSHTYGQQNDGPGRKVRSAKSCKTPPHAATWVKSLSFTGGDAPKLTRYSGDRGIQWEETKQVRREAAIATAGTAFEAKRYTRWGQHTQLDRRERVHRLISPSPPTTAGHTRELSKHRHTHTHKQTQGPRSPTVKARSYGFRQQSRYHKRFFRRGERKTHP